MMLPKRYDPREAEPRIGRFWQESQVYAFDRDDGVAPVFSIDTPPPTVSGHLHLGHVYSYSHVEGWLTGRRRRRSGVRPATRLLRKRTLPISSVRVCSILWPSDWKAAERSKSQQHVGSCYLRAWPSLCTRMTSATQASSVVEHGCPIADIPCRFLPIQELIQPRGPVQ